MLSLSSVLLHITLVDIDMNDIDRLGGSTERKIGKEIERRGRERDEKFKGPVRKLKESLTSEIDQVDNRTSGLKDNLNNWTSQ